MEPTPGTYRFDSYCVARILGGGMTSSSREPDLDAENAARTILVVEDDILIRLAIADYPVTAPTRSTKPATWPKRSQCFWPRSLSTSFQRCSDAR
jgi:hypothetical protein